MAAGRIDETLTLFGRKESVKGQGMPCGRGDAFEDEPPQHTADLSAGTVPSGKNTMASMDQNPYESPLSDLSEPRVAQEEDLDQSTMIWGVFGAMFMFAVLFLLVVYGLRTV